MAKLVLCLFLSLLFLEVPTVCCVHQGVERLKKVPFGVRRKRQCCAKTSADLRKCLQKLLIPLAVVSLPPDPPRRRSPLGCSASSSVTCSAVVLPCLQAHCLYAPSYGSCFASCRFGWLKTSAPLQPFPTEPSATDHIIEMHLNYHHVVRTK